MIIALSMLIAGCTTVATRSLPSVDSLAYQLSPGDRLHLEVFREDTLSGEYVIDDLGLIALPLAGEVRAAGKTLAQLRQDLQSLLGREYVRDARIAIDVVGYRPIYILGEVEKPGEYPYAEGMSVHGLVAKAGGFTYRANEHVVYIRHGREAEEKAYRLTSGAAVLPGDTVRVGQRYF
ncbi:polysaccharide biosynthesis/export family protein [Novosphingobium sp. PP1Y]|uniref:polysaccharide biosynthesis/export family protein n=2 Tax=unclassified Novosphingobium TaxID=2644732 RepID=UPI001E2E99F9|nr:polysaccharide biosynthesis/export family protein [Novosphingobium sp. PP1Y]